MPSSAGSNVGETTLAETKTNFKPLKSLKNPAKIFSDKTTTKSEKSDSVTFPSSFWRTLQISHYNMAVELEHLGQLTEALKAYESALEVQNGMYEGDEIM